MPDIFDQAATATAPTKGGFDIFDQAAAPDPMHLNDQLKPFTPAGNAPTPFTPVKAAPVAKPMSAMQRAAAQGRANDPHRVADEAVEQNNPDAAYFDAQKSLRGSTTDHITDTQLVRHAASMEPDDRSFEERVNTSGALPGGETDRGGLEAAGESALETGATIGKGVFASAKLLVPPSRQELEKPLKEQLSDELGNDADIVKGAGTAAMVGGIPGMGEAGAGLLNAATRAQSAKTVATIVGGVLAGTVSEKVADHELQKHDITGGVAEFIKAVSFFVPTVMGEALGFKTAAGTVDGKTGVGASAFGGRASAGAYASPEEFGAGVRIGDTQINVRVPRAPGAEAAPTDVSQIAANTHASQTEQTMQQAALLDHAVENVMSGKPPLDPPAAPQGPPPPKGMEKGQLTQGTLQNIAQAIKIMPPEMQGQAIQEAHGKLADWIQQTGKYVGPDGKVQIADTPEKAQKMATDILNGEIDRQTKLDDDKKAAQDTAAKEAEKAANEPNANGLTPDELVYQRAKTLLESNPDAKQGLLQRNLRIGYGQATALMERFKAEGGSSGVPGNNGTVGAGGEHAVTEESRPTIDAQLGSLAKGDTNVVMLPVGSKYMPQAPQGMKVLEVKDGPGAGTYYFNPQKIRPQTIKEAAKAGTHGDMLGHIQTKEELADGQPTAVVQAVAADGTPIQDSAVHKTPELVAAQAEVLHERHPDAHIVVKSPEQVVAEREQANAESDIFDHAEAAQDEVEEHNPKQEGASGPSPEQPEGEVSTTPQLASNEVEKQEAAPEETKQIAGSDGRENSVGLDNNEKLPAKYRIVDLNDLTPSHDGLTFAKNAGFPDNVQQRNYHTDKHAQARVVKQGGAYDPDYVLNTNNDAVNGPPVITPDGLVLGGNSRTMSLQRHYADKTNGLTYREALRNRADQFGLKPEDVPAHPARPMLAREIAKPGTPEEMRRISAALNTSRMGALTDSEEAVSAGKNLSPETIDRIGEMLDSESTSEHPATMRQILSNVDSGRELIRKFTQDSAFSDTQQQQYQDSKGVLNDKGKLFVERAVLGNIVGDAETLAAVPQGVLDRVVSSLGSIILVNTHPNKGWDLLPVLRGALAEYVDMKARDLTAEELVRNHDMFAPSRNPAVDAMLMKLQEPMKAVRAAFRQYAGDAQRDMPGQMNLLGDAPDPDEAFNAAFDSHLSKQEFETGVEQAKTHVAERETKRAPRETKPAKTETAKAPAPNKGDWVRFHDRNNIEHTGKVAFTDERIARINADGKQWTVNHRDIIGPGEAGTDEPQTLAQKLQEKIAAGEMPKDNVALRKIAAEHTGGIVDNHGLKAAQEALEVSIVAHARDVVAQGGDQRETYDKLVKLYESQPLLNMRTTTSMTNQAYSTPVPLAYLADVMAGIGKDSKVYEPTAGNGALLIAATPENAHANELNGPRAVALKEQGFNVTENDAARSLAVPAKSQDAVVANPPFGPVKDGDKLVKADVDGYKIGQIDHLIAARALDAMKDGGKAVLILGADKMPGGLRADDKIFFNWLYSHYTVSGHFELDGKMYDRQGAGWPVRVITIDGRAASDQIHPAAGSIQRVGTWNEVYERATANPGVGAVAERGAEARPGGAAPVEREDGPGTVSKPDAVTPEPSDRGQPEGSGTAVGGDSGGESRPVRTGADDAGKPVAPGPDDVRPDADVAQSDRLAKGQPRGSRKPAVSGGDGSKSSLADADNAFQVKYTPASSKKDEGVLIPTNMRDSLTHAMARMEDEVGSIDKFAQKELGYDSIEEMHDALMGLQVDSVAGAIHQIKKGKAVIIGDQTGIGKGRQAAAILRWALKNDKTPIFLSVKDQLFTDMYGDLADIGTHDLSPLLMNADASITLPDGQKVFQNKPGQHRKTLERIADTGQLPEGRNGLFLTYSQINVPNKQREVLNRLSHNAVIVLDESHNAGGASQTGEYVQELLKSAAGVTYLSATYAKRPDNMPVYHRTDIGLAVGDNESLENAMQQGGLPLQTVVSNNLVKAGQFFRRERSYDGVNINQHITKDRRREHVKLSDKATEALRAITSADSMFHEVYVPQRAKQEAKAGGNAFGGGNKAAQMVQHTAFTSVVHNFVKQMLLGMMVDPTVEKAIAVHKSGQKPLIALENTMGSFLSDYVAGEGLEQGAQLDGLDYRTVLSRALARTRAVMVTTPTGDKVKVEVGLHELDGDTRERYRKAQQTIDSLDIDLPISPVDAIRSKLEAAGIKVGEITGRNLAVDYSNPDKPTLSQVPMDEQKDKVLTTRRFNDGRLDGIVLNVSGSTGISLHASERFADQKQRHMIVAQPASDINIFMQMLGRIHRTGQVKLPEYTLMAADLPAQKRPTALLSKKMKSLNANTSSNTESATSIQTPDMLNKYGDAIISQYLKDNPYYSEALDLDGADETEEGGSVDIARKATGRLALLPVAEQEAFYNDVEGQYNDLIKYLDDTNQNDLEPETFDYDAKPVKDQVLVEGSDPSTPFGEDAVYNEFDIKRQSKPVTPEEVTAALVDSLGEGAKNPRERHLVAKKASDELIATLNKQLTEFASKLEPGSNLRNQAAQTADTARTFIVQHPVGSAFRIEINGETFNAAVVNVSSGHKGTGNPYSLSKVKVQLATTGPRFLSIPATRMQLIEGAKLTGVSAESLFDQKGPLSQRERVQVVTGNLLSAFGELENSGGRIINFTKADGTIEQGILLPKKFNIKENVRKDVRVAQPQDVAAIVKASGVDTAKDFGIRSRDGNVGIVKDGKSPSGLAITTPKAKAKGGAYFLSKRLTDIVGDFVTQGGMMRAQIPAGQENAAIAEIQKKAALYAPPSMAEDARSYLQKQADAQPKKTSGVELHASMFGADLLVKAMAKVGKAFYDRDVAPAMRSMGDTAPAIGKQIVNMMYPRAFANPDALESIMHALGERQMLGFKLDVLEGGLEKFFDKLGVNENIAFMDRRRLGVGQPTPELQRLDDMMTAMFDASLKEVQKYKPTLQAKENYQGAIWKVVPGSKQAQSLRGSGKKPLEGKKGFTKQQTLDTLTEGLNNGGELASNNAWKMTKLLLMEQKRYTSIQEHWQDLKGLGLRKFVKFGTRPPDDWMQIPDGIASVYFPAASGEGTIDAGKWYVEPTAGRLLTNFISKDHIRSSALGGTLMAAKNIATAFTLGASPYHAINVSLRAASSQLGLGMKKFWNQGMKYGDSGKMWAGAKDAAQFMAAPVQFARDGAKLIKMTSDFKQFASTQAGAAMLARYPDAPQLLNELFHGGLTLQMSHDYDIDNKWTDLPGELREGNYLGAVARVVPWAGKWIMHPLMNLYIPRLKAGFALAQYSQLLVDNATELANGDVTRAELARRAVDTAENRFGELNYDTMFLNNTVKAALQLGLTSPSWKVGEWRSAVSALTVEMVRSLQEPLKAIWEDVKAGKKTHATSDYFPKLQENQAYFLGALLMAALVGTVITKAMTGKFPWQFIHDTHEKTGNTMADSVWTEFAHPRTGRYNPYTHKPERMSLPLGFQDYESVYNGPGNYLKSSLSEPVSKSIDIAKNRDFYGNYIYDPKVHFFQQFMQAAEYAAPMPIVAEGMLDHHGAQDGVTKVLKAAGLRPTTNSNGDFSGAEREMRDTKYDDHKPLTHKQVAAEEAKHEAAQKHPTARQIKEAIKNGSMSHVEQMFSHLSYADARDVFYNEANDHERKVLRPMFEKKRAGAMKRGDGA